MDVQYCHLLCGHIQFTLIHRPKIPGSYAILFCTESDYFHRHHICYQASFPLWPSFFILSEQDFSSSSVAYWTPTDLGGSTYSIISFHTVYGVLKARILKWFAIPFFNGPCFVTNLHHDPSIWGAPWTAWPRASLSYTRLWAMWSFWLASYDCGFHSGICGMVVLASFCLLDGVKRLVQASWLRAPGCGKQWVLIWWAGTL